MTNVQEKLPLVYKGQLIDKMPRQALIDSLKTLIKQCREYRAAYLEILKTVNEHLPTQNVQQLDKGSHEKKPEGYIDIDTNNVHPAEVSAKGDSVPDVLGIFDRIVGDF